MTLFAAARVIARRDYVATVLSRTFLLFLLGPLIPILFAIAYGAIASHGSTSEEERPVVAVAMSNTATAALVEAGNRIDAQLDHPGLPQLRPIDPHRANAALADPEIGALLSGSLAQPEITGPREGVEAVTGPLILLLDEAQQHAALAHAGIAPAGTQPGIHIIARPHPSAARRRGDSGIARIGQTTLFVLTLLLANMLLWNLVEEKSNKVIEVLAAAVPVRAIFVGKLVAMLAVSLTAVFAWASVATIGAVAVLPPDVTLPVPAVGWPAYALLMLFYFITSYLLFGGVLLGLGAQLGSMREIQSITLPATMVQLILFVFAGSGVGQPGSPVEVAAAIFPLSSPLAMIARAGEARALWPHLLALAWQGAWVVLIIAFAAERFRRGVLQSGPSRRG